MVIVWVGLEDFSEWMFDCISVYGYLNKRFGQMDGVVFALKLVSNVPHLGSLNRVVFYVLVNYHVLFEVG